MKTKLLIILLLSTLKSFGQDLNLTNITTKVHYEIITNLTISRDSYYSDSVYLNYLEHHKIDLDYIPDGNIRFNVYSNNCLDIYINTNKLNSYSELISSTIIGYYEINKTTQTKTIITTNSFNNQNIKIDLEHLFGTNYKHSP